MCLACCQSYWQLTENEEQPGGPFTTAWYTQSTMPFGFTGPPEFLTLWGNTGRWRVSSKCAEVGR